MGTVNGVVDASLNVGGGGGGGGSRQAGTFTYYASNGGSSICIIAVPLYRLAA